MALVTYPLNNIEYSAEDAELFHVTRTSGIYANDSFNYSVSGADNAVVIGTGIGWIKNSEFSGKVIAQKESISLDMGLPDSVYPRIDAIVIQFDSNRNETNIVVKTGVASSVPVAPTVVQTESVYELHLYHVLREAGSLYITPSNITDLRLDSSYCGLMADSVTNIDTTAIEMQVADLIESLQNEISNVIDGSAYLLRDGSTNMTGNLPMDGHKVTELGMPTADGDAVPKKYVDNLSASDVGAFSTDELIPLSNGGTNRDLSGITPYAIIRAASNGTALVSTPTANGAFYATAENGAATFGTLPIPQGGTGAKTAAAALIALGAASATPTVKNITNNYHRAFLVKIGKLVICVLTSKVLNSTQLYSETLAIDDSNFMPASDKTFYVYSDTGHNEALGSNVSNGGSVTVKISTNGEFKISSDYSHTVGEVSGTYWWITA